MRADGAHEQGAPVRRGLRDGIGAQRAASATAIVDDDGALPASMLVVAELTEVSDDVLPGPCRGTNALDQGIVGVGFAVFGPGVAA